MKAKLGVRAGIALLGAMLACGGLPLAAQAGELVAVPSRPGVVQNIYLDTVPTAPDAVPPAWVVLLFAGDDGAVKLGERGPQRMRGNFLMRTLNYWAGAGMVAVVVDAPSDNADGMDDAFRLGGEQVQDVTAAVAVVRGKYPAAHIALVGTSRGTISVGNLLNKNPHLADAYVLTSPVTVAGRGGPGLAGVSWPKGSARVLVVSNHDDGCVVSPFWGAQKMANANGFDFIAVTSDAGDMRMPGACKANSPHGYLGIETQVLDTIGAWLRGESAAAK